MRVLRWLLRGLVTVVVLIAALVIGARFHDGPIGPLPGGALARGTIVRDPVIDWSFATDVQEIELQLESQAISRTTWILVHDKIAYVPASTEYPPGKTWHRHALEDGRAIVRITGTRYPVTLRKIDDPTLLDAVRGVAEKKYPIRPGGSVWVFEMTPRPVTTG